MSPFFDSFISHHGDEQLAGPADSALIGRGQQTFFLKKYDEAIGLDDQNAILLCQACGIVLGFAEVHGWCFIIGSFDSG